MICPLFRSFFILRLVLFPRPFLAPEPDSANTPFHSSSAVTAHTHTHMHTHTHAHAVRHLFLAHCLVHSPRRPKHSRLLKKLPCLLCCHAVGGHRGAAGPLCRGARLASWDAWTAPRPQSRGAAPEGRDRGALWERPHEA